MAPTIGFDFDKCLAEAYTIVPFVLLFEILLPNALKIPETPKLAKLILEKSRLTFYKRLAAYEVQTKGTMFRPSFLRLLPKLIKLRQQGLLHKLFIYSNNTISEILNVADHILSLILQEPPYGVKKDELIMEESDPNRIHTFAPRIHRDNICRNSEIMEGAFREKSLEGIQACLGESILESELWFFDDTRDHHKLMNQIGNQYVVVEPYTIQLSNKVLAELFVGSFDINVFYPGSQIGTILLDCINHPSLMPGFRPKRSDDQGKIIERFIDVLKKFSPAGSGYLKKPWKADYTTNDVKYLENGIAGAINQKKQTFEEIIQTYKSVKSGGVHRGRIPESSRLKRTRKLRKDRK